MDILIADPDSDTRRELELVANGLGYTVEVCSDGSAAFALISWRVPRLLVVELLLSGLDGFELCTKLRQRQTTALLPIVCFSGVSWGSLDLAELMKRRFGATYVPKGALHAEFVRALESALGPAKQRPLAAGNERLGMKGREAIETLTDEFMRSEAKVEDGQRKQVRMRKEYSVRFGSMHDLSVAYTHDISVGGLFVKSNTAPPLNEVVSIQLQLPDENVILTARGRVVHRALDEAVSSRIGFGVQLLDLSDEHRAILEKVLSEAAAQAQARIAPNTERTRFVAVVGLPRDPLLEEGEYLTRRSVAVAEVPTVEAAIEFVQGPPTPIVILAESAAIDAGAQACLELRRIASATTQLWLVRSSTHELSALIGTGAFHTVYPASVSMKQILSDLTTQLKVPHRASPRVPLRIEVSVTAGGVSFEGQMINVSTGGALIASPIEFPVATQLRVSFTLDSGFKAEARAMVVRSERHSGEELRMAVAFFEMSPTLAAELRKHIESKISFREYFRWMKAALNDST